MMPERPPAAQQPAANIHGEQCHPFAEESAELPRERSQNLEADGWPKVMHRPTQSKLSCESSAGAIVIFFFGLA